MLALCIIYLIGFYVLKFIFPELLLQTITNPTLLQFGKFLNSWIGFEYIISFIGGFITYYLFACASSGKFKFNRWQILFIALENIVISLVLDFLPELYTHTSIALMFITAIVCNGKLLYATISFTLHGYLSQFLLAIRGFETVIVQMQEIGILSGFILTTEAFVWLALLTLIFNIKENNNEQDMSPLHQQTP